MGLANLWAYTFGRGYTGGPDFRCNASFQLDLGGVQLLGSLPSSNIVFAESAQQLNFPFRSPGWFDDRCKQTGNHVYVTVLGDGWAYLGPFWKVGNEPIGLFAVTFQLKRAPTGHILSIDDCATLERAIHADYHDYFEAKVPGEYGLGRNTEVRQRAEEKFAPRPFATLRDLPAEKARHLKQYLREIPEHFERRRYGDQSWVYYRIEREPLYPANHYCHPLDEQYYLNIYFHYGIDFSRMFHLWRADAEAAEQRIMSTVRLEFPATPRRLAHDGTGINEDDH